MLKAVSTYLYVKERLHPGILDGLTRSGVQAIEIFAARQHLDYANRKAHVKEIAEWFRGSGVPLNSVHSPLYADYEWGRAGAPPINKTTDTTRNTDPNLHTGHPPLGITGSVSPVALRDFVGVEAAGIASRASSPPVRKTVPLRAG